MLRLCLVWFAIWCKITSLSFTRVSGWTLNGIWSFLRPCLKQAGSLAIKLRGLKIARLYKRNVSGKVTLLPGTELWPVSFNKPQQNEEAFFQKHSWRAHVSPMFPSFSYIQCQFLFPRCKLGLRCTGGNFNENPSMRAVVKILRARASEHSSNSCEQFEQRPNSASTFKLDGTIRYP